MSKTKKLYVIYDKECFLCNRTALALKIRQNVGQLVLLNAREPHEMTSKALKQGLDINEGIVVYFEETFYHGKQAVHLLNKLADGSSFKLRSFNMLFKNKFAIFFLYPLLKAVRNISLYLRGRQKIQHKDYVPIFENVFGEQWQQLPSLIQRHYGNRPYSNDIVQAKGKMTITLSPILRLLAPMMSFFNVFAPKSGKDIPVEVDYMSSPKDRRFVFKRRFYYPHQKAPFEFTTTLWQIKNNLIVDTLKFGLGLKFKYEFDGEKLIFIQTGYCFVLGKVRVPLPLSFILGKGYGEECPLDNNTFTFFIESKHPLFGQIIRYEGVFTLLPTK